MKIVSLFSGCGGLDLGFIKAGFQVIWANEYDKTIWETYEINHPHTYLDKRDIRQIQSSEIPDCVGIIGGPPCQSWSEAGAGRGIDDARGQLFYEYVRIIRDKKPLFFLAENVSGILSQNHSQAFSLILGNLQNAGYNIAYKLLNSKYFQVPQDRQRLIIIGYREDLGGIFDFPLENLSTLTLKDAIYDLQFIEPISCNSSSDLDSLTIPNHEYLKMGFSSIYMSRNRVRSWNEPSFTIQAGARHAPLHPQANKMIFVEKDKFKFDPLSPLPYRRLSVRECARIQTFPDSFIFRYNKITDGYKMVGNAVPVKMAEIIASKIAMDVRDYHDLGYCRYLRHSPEVRQVRIINDNKVKLSTACDYSYQ
jgi:DNA (cytosine-5)-methyltransferase 1